jgi:hypothetical protein
MSAKGGEEIEGGAGGRGSRIRAGTAIVVFGIVADLTGVGVVVESIQRHGRVDTIPGQAFSGLMIVRRDAVPLKYGEAGCFHPSSSKRMPSNSPPVRPSTAQDPKGRFTSRR